MISIDQWRSIFTDGDFYLGIQDHGLASEQQLHTTIKNFQQLTKIPAVAVNDVRYLNEQDDIAFDCLQAMKNGREWTAEKTDRSLKNRHLRSKDEMNSLFSSFWPEVLQETEAIKEKCNVTFDLEAKHMPSFPVPEGQEAHTYLEKQCWEKVNKRFSQVTEEVTQRLSYELQVIKSMKFSDYFLIVADYIDYAKSKHIMVGPGRGSASGSIVAYVLGITDVDPMKYDLLFERFLNPERQTMPDIDVDFSDHRRDEVIDYVRQKYGEEHVAQIITFGTFGARSLLRELFKTMAIDERDAQFVLAKIPAHAPRPIATYVRESEDLVAYIKQSKKLRALFTIATKLEGLPKHLSTHAAGVVISEKPLLEYIPLTLGANEKNLTQFAMNDLEAIGLLKMDFLGLRNLSFLERIVQSIQFSTHKSLSLNDFPIDDRKTYALLQKGQTDGVFQLESQGMKQVLAKLKPTSFEDIVAVNALYRPGPMDYIPTYIKRKHKKEPITYLHPDLEPILNKTYGVLIYQEQIMQIAHKIAGFSLGEADVLRRAISGKQAKLMDEQKDSFIQGSINNGYGRDIATELFQWIVKFSNYGFNRSHAVAYSKISYQLAYLKANYPQYFFAELLGTVSNQEEKIYRYIKDAQDLQIKVLPPSINKSFGKYSVEDQSIRMGLLSIKGVSRQVVKEIIEIRKERPFTDLFDFCLRLPANIVNHQLLELLIRAGGFDETYSNRASLLASIDQAIDQGELFGDIKFQPSLLSNKFGIEERYTEIEDFSSIRKLSDEKELLGVYVSSHPLKEYRRKLQANGYITLQHAQQLVGKKRAQSVAVVQSLKKIRTKRGDPMAFITISDEHEDMEAVIFPELYRKVSRWLAEEMLVFVTGKIESRNNRIQWLLQELKEFDESVLNISDQRLFIQILEADHEQALTKFREIAMKYAGNTSIIIYHQDSKNTYKLTNDYDVTVNDQSLLLLKEYFGNENVVFER
jgi:DNA polymerase-3 subunit alpha